METKSAWEKYDDATLAKVDALAARYIKFISENKTERECAASAIAAAEAAGYKPLTDYTLGFSDGADTTTPRTLKPGDKVWASMQGKAVILAHIGQADIDAGFNILGAHIDSPRLDLKQNPLYEKDGFTLLDTHYYGGIKKYQWVALPLALHGVVAKKSGEVVSVSIGDNPQDPVFCVSDLLPHLGAKQMEKKASEVIEGEALDVLVGNRPLKVAESDVTNQVAGEAAAEAGAAEAAPSASEKSSVKDMVLKILAAKYDIEEADFLSAELEVVPAGAAREAGLDRSMVIGYGQDDRVCAYTSLEAQLALANDVQPPLRTALCILVDKEEIGSVGASGMEGAFFENTIYELAALCPSSTVGASADLGLRVRRALANSRMLSSDVSAGVDPGYDGVFESKNSAYLGRGLVFNKYTGARGKSGSNDARAEYMAQIRAIMDAADVSFQTAELGRVDAGGGGTIAYIPARFGMDVIDSGVAVLSMHSPWEVTSKADIYAAERGYEAFLRAE
jgi:aspartyl aminopeptidase